MDWKTLLKELLLKLLLSKLNKGEVGAKAAIDLEKLIDDLAPVVIELLKGLLRK